MNERRSSNSARPSSKTPSRFLNPSEAEGLREAVSSLSEPLAALPRDVARGEFTIIVARTGAPTSEVAGATLAEFRRLANRSGDVQINSASPACSLPPVVSAGTVAVNSVCPGWVKTDMGGAGATRDVAHGAETAVWLALDAPVTLTGKFVRDREVIPW